MKLRSPLLASVAVAASLITAGCGDDDDEPQPVTNGASGATGATGNTGPLSKAEFISAADAICEEAEAAEEDQFSELFPEAEDPGALSSAQFGQFAEEVLVPSLQSQLDQLRALTPPEGEEDKVGEITDQLEDGIAEIEEDPASLQDGNSALEEASVLAKDYGLKECGS